MQGVIWGFLVWGFRGWGFRVWGFRYIGTTVYRDHGKENGSYYLGNIPEVTMRRKPYHDPPSTLN